ncbi:divalent-cation tolerance protein CutA [Bacteroidota bacterium]
MIIYYVPCKNKKEARTIANELLNQRLIVCANISRSESVYEWEGKIKNNRESVLWIKTLDKHEEEVRNIISKLHSYEVPAIIRLVGRANNKYISWMESCVK